jgi:hypothetical protein
MDIIHHCLELTPVPFLAAAFSIFRYIWTSVQQVQASKQQLQCLASLIAELLQTLNNQYRTGRLTDGGTSAQLEDLAW